MKKVLLVALVLGSIVFYTLSSVKAEGEAYFNARHQQLEQALGR